MQLSYNNKYKYFTYKTDNYCDDSKLYKTLVELYKESTYPNKIYGDFVLSKHIFSTIYKYGKRDVPKELVDLYIERVKIDRFIETKHNINGILNMLNQRAYTKVKKCIFCNTKNIVLDTDHKNKKAYYYNKFKRKINIDMIYDYDRQGMCNECYQANQTIPFKQEEVLKILKSAIPKRFK